MSKPITQNTLFHGNNPPILREIDMPPYSASQTFKKAEKVRKSTGKQGELGI
jgi:hypothetical protein